MIIYVKSKYVYMIVTNTAIQTRDLFFDKEGKVTSEILKLG